MGWEQKQFGREFTGRLKRRLKYFKSQKKMTEREISEKTGLTQASVHIAISDKYDNVPTILTVKLIADALGVDIAELFRIDELRYKILKESKNEKRV